MIFLFKICLVALTGVGLSFTQAPYDYVALIIPCFGVFYYLYASTTNKKQAFFISFFFALAYFVAGLNWIGNALLVEGNEYRWVWPLSVVGLPTLLAIFTGLYLTINHIFFKSQTVLHFIGFCTFLAISEWARGNAFTGFPWNLYGYGPASIPEIAQSLSIIGPYGLTFLTILWGATLGLLFTQTKHKASVTFVVILSYALTYFYGYQRIENTTVEFNQDVQLHIVQPNILQKDKWNSEKLAENFDKHVKALNNIRVEGKKHIIIWPETAMPPILLSSEAAKQRIQGMLNINTILLGGGLVMEPNQTTLGINYYNALLAWKQTGKPEKLYSKSHLVPFGEYVPFQEYIPLAPVVAFKGFQKGNGPQTIKLEGYPSFSPLICYEIIFPMATINRKEERPDYILTITNDGWYGDSAGPRQHFAQARFRAIENGIPVVRSANTGISGIIDPIGKITHKKELLEYGAISAELPLPLKSHTIYSRFGDVPFIVFMIISLFLCNILRIHKY